MIRRILDTRLGERKVGGVGAVQRGTWRVGVALALCLPVPARAGSVLVNAGDNLSQAIEQASPGDTLVVGAGTYTFSTSVPASLQTQLWINKPLTLVAADAANRPVVMASSDRDKVVLISSDDVRLDGFVLVGGSTGILVTDFQVVSGGVISGLVLENLDVTPTAAGPGHGVSLIGVEDSSVLSTLINSANNNGINLEQQSRRVLVANNTITNSQHGIVAQLASDILISGNAVDGSSFSGILVDRTPDSLIASNVVTNSTLNAIHVLESDRVIVMDNRVSGSVQHQAGVAVQGSAEVNVVSNEVRDTGQTAIILHEVVRSRVERNRITGTCVDGITLSDETQATPSFGPSSFNWIAQNEVVSQPPAGCAIVGQGTGLWINSESNGNLAAWNELSGFAENGLSIFRSSGNFALGNVVHGNLQGGIFAWNYPNSTGLPPTDNAIHSNHAFGNLANGQLHLKGAASTSVAFNLFEAVGVPATGGGVKIGCRNVAGDLMCTESGPVLGASLFENTLLGFTNGAFVLDNVQGSVLFRNRFVSITDVFSFTPANVQWDSGPVLGGNFWSVHPVSGNPSAGTPFCDMINDDIGNRGAYCDDHPFESETLGRKPRVVVVEPMSGTRTAAGGVRTIRWLSGGCSFVDLEYESGVGGGIIETNAADTGYFRWTVPSLVSRDDYRVRVICKDSAMQAAGAEGLSAAFSVRSAALRLMVPGRGAKLESGGMLRVAWLAGAGVSGVDVYLDQAGLPNLLGSSTDPSSGHLDVALPAGFTSDVARLYIADIGDSNNQDSVDGAFTIRDLTGSVTSVVGPTGHNILLTTQRVVIGEAHEIEWRSRTNAVQVDLFYRGGGVWKPIVANLPDAGRYRWLVPDDPDPDSAILAAFKNASGGIMQNAESLPFAVPEPSGGALGVMALLAVGVLRRFCPLGNSPRSFPGDSRIGKVLGE